MPNFFIWWYQKDISVPGMPASEKYVAGAYTEYRVPYYTNWNSVEPMKTAAFSPILAASRVLLNGWSDDKKYPQYFISPRYIGNGYGAATTTTNRGGGLWAIHGNVLKASDVPGASPSGAYILQIKYHEGALKALTDPDVRMHREDWFFDTSGVLRLQGRLFGKPWADTIPNLRLGFYPAVYHPDVLFNEVMRTPHYCMNREGGGTCPATVSGD